MGEVLSFFRDEEMTPEMQAHLIQRVEDLTVQIALLKSERERIKLRLDSQE